MSPRRSSLSPTFRFFLLLLFLIGILVVSLSAAVYRTEWRQQLASIQTLEQTSVQVMQRTVAGVFDDLVGDLLFLARQNELRALLDNGRDTRTAIAAEYLALAAHKSVYDQIRFLDVTGMERVRVNHDGGAPSVTPDVDLQDKGRQYYFEDVIRLQPGKVFVSPFDLNIEHGAIEQPLKPMIRIGTPVADANGRKAGILLLNYLGENLLRRLREASATAHGDAMLLNREGDWLLASAITRRRAAQQRLHTLAHDDVLTGLANRVLFFDRLRYTHHNAQRFKRRYGVLYAGSGRLQGDQRRPRTSRRGHRAVDGRAAPQATPARFRHCGAPGRRRAGRHSVGVQRPRGRGRDGHRAG